MGSAVRAKTTATGSGTSIVVNVPTNVNGDLLLLQLTGFAVIGTTWATPSGWTAVQNGNIGTPGQATETYATFYRAASSEPGSYTVSLTSGSMTEIVASMTSFQGVSSTLTYTSHAGDHGTNSATATSSATDTTDATNGSMACIALTTGKQSTGGAGPATAFGAPSGWGSTRQNTIAGTNVGQALFTTDYGQSVVPGTQTSTQTPNSDWSTLGVFLFALKADDQLPVPMLFVPEEPEDEDFGFYFAPLSANVVLNPPPLPSLEVAEEPEDEDFAFFNPVQESQSILVPVTGVFGTGLVGTISISLSIDVFFPTSPFTILRAAIGKVGKVTYTADGNVTLTGVQASGLVGSPIPTWSVAPAGVQALGQVGSVSVRVDCSASPAGLQAAGKVGSLGFRSDYAVTGVQATGQVGAATVAVGYPPVTGVQGSGQVGNVTVRVDNSTAMAGVAASGRVGSVQIRVDTSVPVAGLVATGLVGSAVEESAYAVQGVQAQGRVGVTSPTYAVGVTGVQGYGRVGVVSVAFDFAVAVTGVQAVGLVGKVLAFGISHGPEKIYVRVPQPANTIDVPKEDIRIYVRV